MKVDKRSMVISVRVSEADYADLDALARADRRKLGQYVAIVLEDYLAEKRAKADPSRRKPDR
jgi:hypothetical protein